MRTRAFWVTIHRWDGPAMAGLLVIVSLTGSLLAFYPELERLVHPRWYPNGDPSTWLLAGGFVKDLVFGGAWARPT